jgi:hypothetical protein
MPAMPMADTRQWWWDQRHEEGDEHDAGNRAAGIGHEARDRRDGDQEYERHAREQNVQRDFIGGLLPPRAFDQRDHAIQEAGTRRGGDPHLYPIR